VAKKNDNLIEIPIENAKYYLLSLEYIDDDGKKTVGSIRVIDNKFVFEGDIDESANMFFNVTLKKLVDDYLKVRAEYTEKLYIKKMEGLCSSKFYETHNATIILLDLIRKLGYHKLVEIFEKVPKYYD